MDLSRLTAWTLREKIASGELKSVDLVESVFRKIEEVEDKVNSYITLMKEEALRKASEVDERASRGDDLGPLAGIPTAVKDVLCTKDIATTCGSRMLEDFVPPYDATVVKRLKAADAVIVGKTNMDEFAMGSSTETSYFGVSRNPHDISRVTGGSSGGSASALTAGEALLAIGSDTGGSIRQPASFCGIVGLKPTYGRVSRFGLVAYASSLDQLGPMALNVKDCALLLKVISGHDPDDSTSVKVDVPDYPSAIGDMADRLKIGLPKEYFAEGLDGGVRESIMGSVEALRSEGADVVELSLPHTKYAISTYYLIACAEASSNLERYDGVKYGFRAEGAGDLANMYELTRSQGFGDEVKRRIMLGTYALSAGYYDAYYLKAQKVRTLIKGDFESAFENCDVIITPVSPTPAFRIGEKIDDPLLMYLSDIYTISANLAGIPGVSVPCGKSSDGLPIGLQVLGKPFDESTVLGTAAAVERLASPEAKPGVQQVINRGKV